LILSLFGVAQTGLAAPPPDEPEKQVILDGNYAWTYYTTETGTNYYGNGATYWLSKAIGVAGVYRISLAMSEFWRYMFRWTSNAGIMAIPSPDDEDVWWTVKVYKDNNSPYVSYRKYDIWMYSNSAKTNLITKYSEIESY
jgi:hypothetical protein